MSAVLTPKDMTLLSAIFQHNTNPVVVDWNVVAEQAGHKNGRVSAEMFRQLKKKLGIDTSGNNINGTPSSTPAKKRYKDLSHDIKEEEGSSGLELGSPVKKKQKRTAGKLMQKDKDGTTTDSGRKASIGEQDGNQVESIETPAESPTGPLDDDAA